MNIKSVVLSCAAFSAVSFAACNGGSSTESNTDTAVAAPAGLPAEPISIKPVGESPAYPDAKLSIKDVKGALAGTDSVKVTIDYEVKNYELKNQTADAGSKSCNNSKDGQHIHFILDNNPYAALYEPTKTFTVAANSEHYVMSFLSRSYHESVKSPGAAVLYRFKVDDKGNVAKLEIPKTPMIFYSRPKGEYVGEDTKDLLLDFYVYNTTLSATGDKVKVNINGSDFTIDQWQPYFIQNAPMGDLTVKVQLVDKDGKDYTGDNATVSRIVKLAAEEPVKQ
ncbi:MAG: hypothetical protein QM642_03180 [Edaphocola sp.]